MALSMSKNASNQKTDATWKNQLFNIYNFVAWSKKIRQLQRSCHTVGQKSEFCSKTSIGALLILGTNRGIFEILTLKVLKNPKGGPFYVK